MNIAVVTAVIGGIDQPKVTPVQTVESNWHFFTDPPPTVEGNDRMKALWYKTHILNNHNYQVAIWLDGKVQVTSDDFIQQILDALGGHDIAVLKHHERHCIYQEIDHIEHCMKKGNQYLLTRYANKPIRRQVEAYRYFGYPKNNGLNDCCIIAARITPRMQGVFDSWWHDVYRLDGFDQVALQYYCWAAGVKIQPIIFKPGSFTDVPHAVLK